LRMFPEWLIGSLWDVPLEAEHKASESQGVLPSTKKDVSITAPN
jgi:hypothetical protein